MHWNMHLFSEQLTAANYSFQNLPSQRVGCTPVYYHKPRNAVSIIIIINTNNHHQYQLTTSSIPTSQSSPKRSSSSHHIKGDNFVLVANDGINIKMALGRKWILHLCDGGSMIRKFTGTNQRSYMWSK